MSRFRPAPLIKRVEDDSILSIAFDQIYAANASSPLNIPTYIGTEAVHPSVLYFPFGWNGYKYWMAMTPYQNTDSQYENPSIAVSNDGKSWIVPTGITNPIVPKPPSPGYNSDPSLFMEKDGEVMNLIYREVGSPGSPAGTEERIYLLRSRDGISWTPRVPIITNDVALSRPVSPSCVWDGSKYIIWFVDIKQSPKKLMIQTAVNLIGPWTAPVATDLVADAGRQLWHAEVRRYMGMYIALMQDNSTDGGTGNLYFATSFDGLTWARAANPLMYGASWRKLYKSSFVPMITVDGPRFALWYGTQNVPGGSGWKVWYTETASKPAKGVVQNANNLKIAHALQNIQPYVVGDSFDRADTTTGLGTANTGQAWTADAGTFGISGGLAVPTTAVNTRTHIETNNADISVAADVYFNAGNQVWLIARYTDGSNYLRAGVAGVAGNGALYVQRIQAGGTTELFNGVTPVSGDHLEFEVKGSTLRLYHNGLLVAEVTETFNQTATKAGIQVNSDTSKLNNFTVRKS